MSHRQNTATWIVHAAVLALIIAVSAFGLWMAVRSINAIVDRGAEVAARQWAETFIANSDILNRISAGEQLTPADERFIERIEKVGNVFRFKVFDETGRLMLLSDQLGDKFDESLQDHRPEIVETLLNGGFFMDAYDGRQKPDRPDFYAEAYLPIMSNGRMTGIVEVYVDVTSQKALVAQKLKQLLPVILVLGVIGLFHTVYTASILRQRLRGEQRIHELAFFDPTTGIANRSSFNEHLEKTLQNRKPEKGSVSLFTIDLDGFKAVNDTFGHDVGDRVLAEVATELDAATSRSTPVFRIGGDEFAVVNERFNASVQTLYFADLLIRAVERVRTIDEIPVNVSASVGIAMAPEHASTSSELQKCSDIALYQAKAAGRGRAAVFSPGMDALVYERTTLRNMLITAIDEERFELHFQPLHDTIDENVVGFEALLRLSDADGKPISPSEFIPVVEELGKTPVLGAWVLKQACRAAAGWDESLRIAVNLSPQQFGGAPDLIDVVREALVESGLTPGRLELEITESLFVGDRGDVEAKLIALKKLGVRIAMDDFGTGYSSLSCLWQFPFDKVKVDRSFINALSASKGVDEVLRAILAMSNAMNLTVTAEGVETDEQRTFLRQAGYNEVQGFLFSRALPLSAVEGYLSAQDAAAASRSDGMSNVEMSGVTPIRRSVARDAKASVASPTHFDDEDRIAASR